MNFPSGVLSSLPHRSIGISCSRSILQGEKNMTTEEEQELYLKKSLTFQISKVIPLDMQLSPKVLRSPSASQGKNIELHLIPEAVEAIAKHAKIENVSEASALNLALRNLTLL